jgi:multiple sugar transport system substrate-binding protein
MKKRCISLALALVMVLSLGVFTACGEDDGTPHLTIQLLGLTDEEIEAYRAEGTLYAPPGEGPALHLAQRRAIEAMDGFTVEFVDWGWAETLDARQRTAMAAGDVPDIVGGEVFMPAYANEGILYPLPQDIVDIVVDGFIMRDPAGVPVAFANGGSVFMLFYNRDLLEAAGFSNPPTTWDEWLHMGAVITEMGNGQFFGGGVPSFPHAGGALRATPFFRMLGIDFFQGGSLQLDDPRLHEALEFIRATDAFLPPGLGNAADEGPLWNAFEDGNIAFVVNGTWQAGGAERAGLNWGVAPLPIPAGGVAGNCLVGVTFFGVPRGASHPEISFDILRTILQPEIAQLVMYGRASPLREHQGRADLIGNEAVGVAMNAVGAGGTTGLVAFPQNSAQIWEIINSQVLARTTIDTATPVSTITTDAAGQIQGLLN